MPSIYFPPVHPSIPSPKKISEKLQPPGNSIDQTLRRGPDAQHGAAAGRDLRAPGVGDHLGRHPEAARLAHQLEQLVLALDLHRDLGLPGALPLPQDLGLAGLRGELGGAEEGLVACEGCVRGLGGNFAWFVFGSWSVGSVAVVPRNGQGGRGGTNPWSCPNPS